ncbi:hypothetical protein [Nonomuraea sp. LPB2021202275-12-8]|uniref:hypothetical protein n=1 Tax=Nonomuraea sp. LPB2021202275-12-8 TaxID=3120159 RepID=UPI00300D444B
MSGVPHIDFRVHATRQNDAGGRDEFEQMLGLLVRAVEGIETSVPHATRGDWGIDVLAGDLNGRIRIWQAKYFIRGFDTRQRVQVDKSFKSAVAAATREGHAIDGWVLCIPCNMDPPNTRWWGRWKADREAETGIPIELWDDNRLRDLLARPESDHVRRLYYDPYRPPADDVPLTIVPSFADLDVDGPWQAGSVSLGHLLHADAVEVLASDRAWAWREATADRVAPPGRRVSLRQVRIFRDSVGGTTRRDGLLAQARLLDDLHGARGLPRKESLRRDGDGSVTLATALPDGPLWREVLGPAFGPAGPLDRLSAAAALAAAAGLCDTLYELHRRGHAHRALSPETVVLRGGRHEGVPRDLGLAALPPVPGEGHAPYQAPEQHRPTLATLPPGPRTDVYQVAALVRHTLSGLPGTSPPLRAVVPETPVELDDLLARALDADPAGRPDDIRTMAAGLRRARAELSRGGGR